VVQKFIFNIDMKEEIKKTYYSNGQLQYEIPYKNGRLHGLEKWWYMDGQLRYEILYKNDIKCGAGILFKY